jgi:hypothetical protein
MIILLVNPSLSWIPDGRACVAVMLKKTDETEPNYKRQIDKAPCNQLAWPHYTSCLDRVHNDEILDNLIHQAELR